MSYSFATYNVTFRSPWRTARSELRERNGFLIYNRETRGLAEAALLPEFGTETLEAASQYLATPNTIQAPATQFAVRSAEHPTQDLKISRVRVARMLSLEGETAELRKRCATLLDEGFQVVKCKLGVLNQDDEVERLNLLAREFSDLGIRVDANLAYTREQMLKLWSQVRVSQFEFVEDPCPFCAEDWSVLRSAGMRIACDEPAGVVPLGVAQECCDALVLKPAKHGSPEAALHIARSWTALGKEVVISSLLDSHVGLCQLAAFAAKLEQSHVAHGLGTVNLFTNELLPEAARLHDGHLHCGSPAALFDLLPREWQEQLT